MLVFVNRERRAKEEVPRVPVQLCLWNLLTTMKKSYRVDNPSALPTFLHLSGAYAEPTFPIESLFEVRMRKEREGGGSRGNSVNSEGLVPREYRHIESYPSFSSAIPPKLQETCST